MDESSQRKPLGMSFSQCVSCSHGLAVRGFGLVTSGQTAGISGEKNLLTVNGNMEMLFVFQLFSFISPFVSFLFTFVPLCKFPKNESSSCVIFNFCQSVCRDSKWVDNHSGQVSGSTSLLAS